ncbi:putative cation-transporting ATPase E [Longimycelium tulufanense]|uniref:Putative cation-transporting ATPase E n=1 Tax=Longimycelium tulufanense TaxID=907463 RepID=A0A8J3CAU0_9PSEU|nr:HAD-IC family P-type ATPase [Longimycelium tulufanense]GGM52158.1 putative cation-transporting ATPase E [Longimycelium tulufanense]
MPASPQVDDVDVVRGLSAEQVRRRVAAGQTNDVPARASRSATDIVRANVLTRFNAIIGVLFVMIMVVGPAKQGLFGLIIVINTVIGIFQELRAKQTLDKLAIIGEARPHVLRDGEVVELPPNQVVLDDMIALGPGDKIVVDGAVTAAEGLEVDESLLTGEADPVLKQPGDQVLSGSFVVAGSGRYRATKVGREAYAAKLAEEASRFTLVHSELRSGINDILRIITWLLVPGGALIIWSQLLSTPDLPGAIRGMVAALVPMVPEGLVLLTSVAFAVGVIRLGFRKCLVQELPAIEGLARVDVVCADKTGTLTDAGMHLAEVRQLDSSAPVPDVLGALAATDPRPNASLQAIAEAHPSVDGWRATAVAPFSSARKWSGASFGEHGHWVLGAPEVLLPPDSPVLADAEQINVRGLRVLLLGRAAMSVDDAGAPGAVEPAALVVLEQKIRPDAAPTLRYFAEQDVEVKVISGDNARSVGAVATTLELPRADRPVDARELPAERDQLAERLAAGTVFGRVTPAQKRDMVGALQSRGHVVAMTGDGVNDVLALKDADIGVAMGTGSPATRAVAQIVLLDNKFATLPYVVAEGRRVIGNIERVANLFLTKTVYSVLLAILIGVVHVPFPFTTLHLTLVGSLTIGTPAFFLALAPNVERARSGFVQRVLRMAVPAGIVAGLTTFITYWIARGDASATPREHQTAAVVALFLVAFWVLAIVARPYVWWKLVLLGTMFSGFLLALLLPLGQRFFELDPSHPHVMLTALVSAAVAIALLEVGWWLDGWFRQEKRRLIGR